MKKLKEIMKQKGYTQAKLAKELKVSRQSVNNWLTGKNEPGISKLRKITLLLNVKMEDIFFTKD